MRSLVALTTLLALLTVGAGTADAQRARKGKQISHKAEGTRGRGARGVAVREEGRSQSVGLPWAGHLENGVQLKMGDSVFIRRPYRAWGTRTTIDYVKRAITETVELYPRLHVLSIGDISAENGGQVSDHHSHQSGRDIDIGLYYNKQPAGYPSSFINANESNLNAKAMWALISKLAATSEKDGGVKVIFLDFEVQGIIYRWAQNHGVSDRKLERIFQYANGAGSNEGLVRHYRNHQHHIHVRFNCARADRNCS